MKANYPFDTGFVFRKELEEIEKPGEPEMTTKEEQFDFHYDSIFAKTIKDMKEAFKDKVSSGTAIKDLKGFVDVGSMSGAVVMGTEWPLITPNGFVGEYGTQPRRYIEKGEVEITLSDMIEWFQNSGFPGFTGFTREMDGQPGYFYIEFSVNV